MKTNFDRETLMDVQIMLLKDAKTNLMMQKCYLEEGNLELAAYYEIKGNTLEEFSRKINEYTKVMNYED